MKIIIIPCVLYFPGVIGAVDVAAKNLRGSHRDLQLFEQFDFGSVGDNDPFATLTTTSPTQPSLPFQFLVQPNQPINNAPVLGNSLFTSPTNPTNLSFLQPTDPADTPMFGGFGSGEDFDFGSMFGPPFFSGGSQSGIGFGDGDQIVPNPIFLGPPLQAPPSSGAGDLPPNLPSGLGGGLGFGDGSAGSSGCPKSGDRICIALFDPVICGGGCQYSNSCFALGAGFAASECRPN
jgi:hypothetical protein